MLRINRNLSKAASNACMLAKRGMAGKDIKFGVDGRARMLEGVNLLAGKNLLQPPL